MGGAITQYRDPDPVETEVSTTDVSTAEVLAAPTPTTVKWSLSLMLMVGVMWVQLPEGGGHGGPLNAIVLRIYCSSLALRGVASK